MISTDAWVLHRGEGGAGPGQLVRERYDLPDPSSEEVVARPLFGCWEGNMDHAIRRSPVDVCALRNEERVVLGNAGVVEVIDTGAAVTTLRRGDLCLLFCNGTRDEHGYPITILGYDSPGTVGVLAKTIKLKENQLIRVPKSSKFSLRQWAAFSLRYITAWANWRVAYRCWRAQMEHVQPEETFVFGWGGGVAFAELSLAKLMGCHAVMIASIPARLELIKTLGIDTIDRGPSSEGGFEQRLVQSAQTKTGGRGVSIFVDNVGSHYRTTLKTLGRQGVITTSGWKNGLTFPVVRASECISRHIHVFTHYACYSEGLEAVCFATEHDWMPPDTASHYSWEDIPRLAEDYANGRVETYFPIFSIAE